MIEGKLFKVFTIVVIIIATYTFIEIILKQDEYEIHSLSLFPTDRKKANNHLCSCILVSLVAAHLIL